MYLLYLKKDDQHGSRLLNVLNGDLMILLSFQNSVNFTELSLKKVIEDENCALLTGKRISNLVFVQMCFLLTSATLLNHFRQTRGHSIRLLKSLQCVPNRRSVFQIEGKKYGKLVWHCTTSLNTLYVSYKNYMSLMFQQARFIPVYFS